MRVLPRSVEAAIGGKLIEWGTKTELKRAGLVPKSAMLPRSGIEAYYFERGPQDAALTVVLYHGMSEKAEYMAGFLSALEISLDIRVLIPDAPGHGQDLKRARKNPAAFQQPTPSTMVDTMVEFLDTLQVKQCYIVGYSMGGALAYWVRQRRPDVVAKSVLIAPALEQCIDDEFLNDYLTGKKRQHCYETRTDVKILFRDLSHPNRKKKDPVPKFFLEAFARERKRTTPPKHYDNMMHAMLKERGDNDGLWSAKKDVDPGSPRLVLWPDHDFICNHEKGQAYFEESNATDFETIQDCGHSFLADGDSVLLHVAPRVSRYLFAQQEETALPK